jgi:ferredoxin-NADP reductase/Na+-translocating ferredoxin:NAD+ oxidoreductase RnfD subunit
MKYIDNFLNRITMYKLVLWGLMILAGIAVIFSVLKPDLFPGNSVHLLESVILLYIVCGVANKAFARIFKVQTNSESAYITALILFFILAPVASFDDVKTFIAIAVIAMASKYILAIQKKHVFNPVAISLVIVGLFGSGTAIWWVGSVAMLPFVIIFGFLILRKLQRFQMFLSFMIFGLVSTLVTASLHGISLGETLIQSIVSGPILFFGTLMFTEPLTTPPKKSLQILYGVVVGVLFGAQFNWGPLFSSAQLALVVGNILSFLISPRDRLVLTLVEKNKLAGDVYDFVWKKDRKFVFRPGQYLEWTLGHHKPDSRGNRRYFTIASSPAEEYMHLGAKFYPNPSTFKIKLDSLKPGDQIIASQLSGEFTLSKDKNQKLVFIAGGIGVTPFRSMAKYLMDTNEHRDIVMLYSNRTPNEIAYKDIFETAENIGLRTIHIVNDSAGISLPANMRLGMINADLIRKDIPDYKERMFYISGPHGMVSAFEGTLQQLGIPQKNIKVDFFPGFV